MHLKGSTIIFRRQDIAESALLDTYHVRVAQKVSNVIQVCSNMAGFVFYFVLIIIKSSSLNYLFLFHIYIYNILYIYT